MYQLKVNQQQTIVALRGQGRSKRRIALELDVDRATVRKYLAQADSKSPTPQTGSSPGFGPASLWEPRREAIERALAQGLSIQRIYQDLVAEGQFTGSYFAPLRGCIFMMSSISIWLA